LTTSAAQTLIDAALQIPEIDGAELGFTLVERRDHGIDAPGYTGRFMVWRKTRSDP
jgi:hypothetical protein